MTTLAEDRSELAIIVIVHIFFLQALMTHICHRCWDAVVRHSTCKKYSKNPQNFWGPGLTSANCIKIGQLNKN